MKNSFTLARPASKRVREASAGRADSHRYVEVLGTRVRYIVAGGQHAGTPLLMVHGYNGSCQYWYPHPLPGLAAERRVIAFDLPGNGWSGGWEREKYSLDAYAAFIPDFMHALGIAQADLLGHSMGGLVALAAVAGHPHRFRRLVLVDSAGASALRFDLRTSMRMLTDPSLWQVRLYPTFLRMALRTRAAGHGLSILRARSIPPDSLKALALPTLVIWGRRDRLIPPDHGSLIAKHIPGARHVIINGAGHMPFYERPEEFNRHVLDFLR